jgi:hypothetical protein
MSRKDPLTASAVILCVEIEQACDEKGWRWTVICSRAGTEGTFTKEWRVANGRLSQSQVTDLNSWVGVSVDNALIAWGGIQTELDAR